MDTKLENYEKKAEYYKKTAERTGNLFLRETQELAKLVTRIREIENTLREREEKLRYIIENSNEMFYLKGADHKFIYVSPQSSDIFGYTPEEMKSKWTELVIDHPDNKSGVESTDRVKKTGEKQKTYIVECLRKDGQNTLVEIVESPVEDENGNVVAMAGAARDVTEREKLAADLRQAVKMEAIGILAGGIAHDFNNLLMGIQGRTSLMMMDIDSPRHLAEHLEAIEEHIQSASGLTKQLLAFARKGRYEVKPVDLNHLIKKASQMFGRTKKNIEIKLFLQPDLWTVEMDKSQMEQVLLNLFINAWHAMPCGGEICVNSENKILEDNFVNLFSVPSGNYVKIAISDSGIGIDEDIKEKIFDPFFTTKERGRGTGLGLASVYGIVKNHNGIINVCSEKGKGTTFNIYLPESMKKAQKTEEYSEEILPGNETVLLVDDESMILNTGKALLERLGYKVIIAESGVEAVTLYEMENNNIDIVLLDLIMPVMSGIETYKHLKQMNPDIKILFSSGYNMDEGLSEIIKRNTNGFIQKPYKCELLSQKLRTILDMNRKQ